MEIHIAADAVTLHGDLQQLPANDRVVIFAYGSGSGRRSLRNQSAARKLREHGFGTLLFDLLSEEEEAADRLSSALRFDIGLLSRRLQAVTGWLRSQAGHAAVGYFGASTGAAAALLAAARDQNTIGAIVSRGGRPDLAGREALGKVRAPTLLLIGSHDGAVVDLNRQAFEQLRCEKRLHLVRGATHLFEEASALDEVSRQAVDWFGRFLHARRDTTE